MTDVIKTELAQINSQIDYAWSGVNSIEQWVQSQSKSAPFINNEAPEIGKDMAQMQKLAASNHKGEVSEHNVQQ